MNTLLRHKRVSSSSYSFSLSCSSLSSGSSSSSSSFSSSRSSCMEVLVERESGTWGKVGWWRRRGYGGGDGMVVPSSSYQQLQCDLQHQDRHRHRPFAWITPFDRPCDTMPWCFCIVCLEFAISTSIPHINLHLSSPSLSAFQSPSQSPYLSPSPSPYPSPLQPNLLNPAG